MLRSRTLGKQTRQTLNGKSDYALIELRHGAVEYEDEASVDSEESNNSSRGTAENVSLQFTKFF